MKKLIEFIVDFFREYFLVLEIKSKKGVLHFQRWRIFSSKYISIYIHKIYQADTDKHLHNHPWNYLSIMLYGGYQEKYSKYGIEGYRTVVPFDFKLIKHKDGIYHKIDNLLYFQYPTITLFITGRKKYDWGYNVDGQFVNNLEYRKMKRENKFL